MKVFLKVTLSALSLILAGGFFYFFGSVGLDVVKNSKENYNQDFVMTLGASIFEAIKEKSISQMNYCSKEASFFTPDDKKFCFNIPKQNAFRLFEINLTDNRILFYENGLLSKIFPIAYQSPYGKWFQTPTGYFQIGVKKPKFMSSITDVFMENAVQFYEDFFIHGIPYFPDGTKVSSQFSGGCIRLEDNVAKDFFNLAQKGDTVVSYLTLENLSLKNDFASPVDKDDFWIRQRFNSPLRNNWYYFKDKRDNYVQHTGLDLSPLPSSKKLNVYAIADGQINRLIKNGLSDSGLGNTIIIEHQKDGNIFYSLYGHLNKIEEELTVGKTINAGDKIGAVGNTGYGCNFWKIGKDGCSSGDQDDVHLHLEIKDSPVLFSPKEDDCWADQAATKKCVGYTSEDPSKFGYQDPLLLIFQNQ
ncbi:MAG: peptidoglycan DD-metalloendopeptidase family protein [Candidatus Paceibacterota bacterium]|jgi:hypothetical protein